jgi:uncharacterized repeat protein (TIGR03847 family)
LAEDLVSREIYNLDKVERFVLGTVGMPGERQFFLQVRKEGQIFSFALEKAQAKALTDRFTEILKDARLGTTPVIVDNEPLQTPVESEFELGVMAISWKYDSDSISFEAQGISSANEPRIYDEMVSDDVSDAPPILKISLTPVQVRSFVSRANSVIRAGRQPCMFCGGPINLDGHICPRAN